MNARILPYDWFKFIILLILIALLITLGRCVPAITPAAGDSARITAGESDQMDAESASGNSDSSRDATSEKAAQTDETAGQTSAESEETAGGAEGDATSEAAAQTDEADGQASVESEEAAGGTVSQNCPKALPARLSGVGTKAVVINALIPLRSSPQVAANILDALPIGSVVEITALPICTEYLDGANLWWGVRTSDGRTGFAAEGSAISPTYYLEKEAASN